MLYRSNHPLKIYLSSKLLIFSLIFIAVVLGACTEKENADAPKAHEKIVMPIRKPITSPPVPLNIKNTDGDTPEMQDTMQTALKTQDEPEGLIRETYTSDDASMQGSPDVPSRTIGAQGLYKVRKGDRLADIAERADVYDNPLKWTSLFRLNLEKFEGMKITRDFQNRELPQGLHLKFVTASEAKANIKKLGKRIYAVNVLSAETSKKITPCAITLIRNGYNAYICTAMIHDKEWMRLRAGFFKTRKEAAEAGKQIATLLDETKVWVVKISQAEINGYCGDE